MGDMVRIWGDSDQGRREARLEVERRVTWWRLRRALERRAVPAIAIGCLALGWRAFTAGRAWLLAYALALSAGLLLGLIVVLLRWRVGP